MRIPVFPVLATFTLCPLLAFAGPGTDNPFDGKRALIIGIDGLRVDALQLAVESGQAPYIGQLIEDGTVTWQAYAGGRGGDDPTTQATVSGPGWSSVLTGTWANKHGVVDNGFQDNHLDRWPHFFHQLKEVAPDAETASGVDWPQIHDYILASAGEDSADHSCCLRSGDYGLNDEELASQAADWLADSNPDVIFLYQGQVDGAGHGHGFSPESAEYMNSIATVDANLGLVLDALKARPEVDAEDWLIVLTTDHGGIGRSHGGQSPEERTIPLLVSGGSAAAGRVSEAQPGQTAVPATVFSHLGLVIESDWGWEDPAFGLDAE